jgi:hypothetical protein
VDYIDRGPDSYGVLKTVSSLSCETILLKGNHEDMAISYFNQPVSPGEDDIWRSNGGEETLRSVPFSEWNQWLDWMNQLKYYHEEPDYYFVHASFSWSFLYGNVLNLVLIVIHRIKLWKINNGKNRSNYKKLPLFFCLY